MIRAAIALQMNAFDDTGAIVAAMTTSIPESANSGRNWDYRYCWLRDSYFVVNVLNRLGATQTMENYIRTSSASPQVRATWSCSPSIGSTETRHWPNGSRMD